MSAHNHIWQSAILPLDATIGQAIENLNRVPIKIILIANKDGFLEGTISDGDIRRGLLHGFNLENSLAEIIHRNPLVVPPEFTREHVLQVMRSNKVHQIPIVNHEHKIVGLHLWDELTVTDRRDNIMIIMAGGMGTRLYPHTENCPKPLLPIAGKPILEHIIDRAKIEGFNHFVIAVRYLAHMIESYFGDGEKFGVKIDYLREDSPLGTAGALHLLSPCPNTPFIVTNGDVLTDIRYGELLDFHLRYEAMATMAVRLYEWQHPFGVVKTDGVKIIDFEEKPVIRSHINAGIYALNPEALTALSEGGYCDMPNLFERLKSKNNLIVAYPMHEPWLDIGRPDDLLRANKI